MEKILCWFNQDQGQSVFVFKIFLIVFGTGLFYYIAKRVCDNAHQRLLKTKNRWDDALVLAVSAPLGLLIWILGMAFAGMLINASAEDLQLATFITLVKQLSVVFCLAWFVLRLIQQTELILTVRAPAGKALDKTTADALSKLLRLSVIITAVLIALQTMGISIAGVLAFGGVGGIVIGFAAKDLLANFFGGLMIYLDRPFKVGDWICSPEHDIEGEVEQIGWRMTRIRRFNKRPIYVPNALFSTISIENPTRMQNRQINEVVGIRYDDAKNVKKIVDEIQAMMEANEGIDPHQRILACFNEFADSSLNIIVYCFTKTIDRAEFQKVKQEILINILSIIEANHAEIAFPTRTLHMEPSHA